MARAARVVGPHTVEVRQADGGGSAEGDAILVATGSAPRRMDTAPTDGEVILSSQDVYKLRKVPEHLVVVGAGATGAEYATAFLRFGAQVTFVVSRDRILTTEDHDAAMVIEDVFERQAAVGEERLAAKVERVGDRGVVHPRDGCIVEGSHVLLTIGQVPRTSGSWPRGAASGPTSAAPWSSTGSAAPRCPASTPPATSPPS